MANFDPSKIEESQKVERKEAFNDRCLKTLCAFLNTDGGSLFIPVRDNGEVLDAPLTDRQQQNIVNQITAGLNIQPNIVTHTWDGREFLEIEVAKAQSPVQLRGRFYIRVGNTTQEMSEDQLKYRMLAEIPWDAQIAKGITIDDLDVAEIKRFVLTGQDKGRINLEVDPNDPDTILMQTGLLNENGLTNAAVLLFGKTPQLLFPYAKVRVGLFAFDDEVLDDKMIEGHLFQQTRRAEEIIKNHMIRGYEISAEGFERKDNWEYPLPAFREGLMNAVLHRDYHRRGAEVQIKLFPDRLIIFSPGGLPEGLSVDRLLDTHSSIQRNRLLADIFYRAGLIEAFGTGISRIQNHLEKAGLPEPMLDDRGDTFVLTFNQKKASTVSAITEELNERQLKALELAKEGRIRTSDLHEFYPDVDSSTIRGDFRKLVKKDLLKAIGTTKDRFYIINS